MTHGYMKSFPADRLRRYERLMEIARQERARGREEDARFMEKQAGYELVGGGKEIHGDDDCFDQ